MWPQDSLSGRPGNQVGHAEVVESGERYNVDEIEFWFENEGSWKSKESRIRIVNLSNYIQDKYQQTAHLRVISDDDCNCKD